MRLVSNTYRIVYAGSGERDANVKYGESDRYRGATLCPFKRSVLAEILDCDVCRLRFVDVGQRCSKQNCASAVFLDSYRGYFHDNCGR